MLTIRKEQMEVLRAVMVKRFEDRMVKHLAALYPQRYEAMGEAGARQFIQKGIETGAGHGIRAEGAVAALIKLMIEFGEQFELSPDQAPARDILAHPTLPDKLKVDLIREQLTARTKGRIIEPVRRAE